MPLFNKVTGIQRLQKVTLTQVFLCEINEIFKNTCFEVHLRTVASDNNPVNIRLLANSILEIILLFKTNRYFEMLQGRYYFT